jgi:hypothetical protein
MKRVWEGKWKSASLHLAKLDRLHRFIVCLFLAAVVFMVVGAARYFYLGYAAKTAGRQDNGASQAVTADMIEIRNNTKALEVLSKKVEKESLGLELRNAGPRGIISYRIDFVGADRYVADLSAGGPIATSVKTSVIIPVKKLAFDQQSQKYTATISMALFDDGTGEGDQAKIASQRDRLIGQAQAFSDMSELVYKLQTEADFVTQQFEEHLRALKGLMPANFNRDQTTGYMSALQSMQARAMVLNKLAKDKKADGMQNFKNAFARQMANLKMFNQEAKK